MVECGLGDAVAWSDKPVSGLHPNSERNIMIEITSLVKLLIGPLFGFIVKHNDQISKKADICWRLLIFSIGGCLKRFYNLSSSTIFVGVQGRDLEDIMEFHPCTPTFWTAPSSFAITIQGRYEQNVATRTSHVCSQS